MKSIFNYFSLILILLVFAILIGSSYTSGCCFEHTFNEPPNKSNANVVLLLPQPFLQNTAITAKNTGSIYFNSCSSLIKNSKTSLALLPFIEQHTILYFKKYNFFLKNKLISYGRKAIFFPFQYFW